jgi:hypothetical protein
MRIRVLAGILALAAAALAAAPAPPPAAYADNAEPAKDVAGEYEFIEQHPCVCGGVLVPYKNDFYYVGDVIVEAILTRCPKCREDRTFYFDCTPRYGSLSSFRKKHLDTRAQAGPSDDQPCPTAATAITVNSISEEYILLFTTAHTCGSYYERKFQSLGTENGHWYDTIKATCSADGAETDFYFLIDSFYGKPEVYPELKHRQKQKTPPDALVGRTIETAFTPESDAAMTEFLEGAKHAADGGALKPINGYETTIDGQLYGVGETVCEKCGLPVRLFVRFQTDQPK